MANSDASPRPRTARSRRVETAPRDANPDVDPGGAPANTEFLNLTGGISEPTTGLLSKLHEKAAPNRGVDLLGRTFADYVMLWGYLYQDPDNTRLWRLYLSLDFDEYIEFDQGNYIKQIDLFNANQPLAGTLVWIDKTATVRRVREERAEDEGNFLKGAIAKGFLGMSGPISLSGFTAFSRGQLDPGSGGGCGSGSPLGQCGG